uniref:non-specific serine/threonine protein kinase n=1 Tax=Strongyloides venezuelensis TaxID=75913 RepID=A0A0K0FTE8_STRVS
MPYYVQSLSELLKDSNDSKENIFFTIALRIMNALGYLCSKNITHGDIKPSNILLKIKNNLNSCVLSDYGTSKFQPSFKNEKSVGTCMFMSLDAHLGILTFRGDFLNFFFMMLHIVTKLPWYNLQDINEIQNYKIAFLNQMDVIIKEVEEKIKNTLLDHLFIYKSTNLKEKPNYKNMIKKINESTFLNYSNIVTMIDSLQITDGFNEKNIDHKVCITNIGHNYVNLLNYINDSQYEIVSTIVFPLYQGCCYGYKTSSLSSIRCGFKLLTKNNFNPWE